MFFNGFAERWLDETAIEMRIVRTMSSLEDAGRLGDITAFEAKCRQATTLEQLKSLLDAIVRQFGFRWLSDKRI